MQESTTVPLRRVLALFGGLILSVPAGLIPVALFGHPWGDIIGQALFVTCVTVGSSVALGGRTQALGIALPQTAVNLAGLEYFRWNRGEPLAIAVLLLVVVANVALLSSLRPWRRTPMSGGATANSARS